jgi:hypothetical protein
MNDEELLTQILASLNDEGIEGKEIGELFGTKPETLHNFVREGIETFISQQQEDHDGLPLMSEHDLKNLFLVGLLIGSQFRKRKEQL